MDYALTPQARIQAWAHIFIVRHADHFAKEVQKMIVEKYLQADWMLFVAFMDLVKVYRNNLWDSLNIYGTEGMRYFLQGCESLWEHQRGVE